jgi:hypothetical protein
MQHERGMSVQPTSNAGANVDLGEIVGIAALERLGLLPEQMLKARVNSVYKHVLDMHYCALTLLSLCLRALQFSISETLDTGCSLLLSVNSAVHT